MWRKIVVLFLVSVVISGIFTTYFEEYQKSLLMPIRNIIVLGTWDNRSEEDVPITYYGHAKGINPVHVALSVRRTVLKILEEQHHYPFADTDGFRKILDIADYFIGNAEEHYYEGLKFYVWTYNFDWPTYNLSAPWVSGMAQGHVIEVMLAAHKLTGEEEYLEAARFAANAMAVPLEHGGVAVEVDGGLWFEEYAKAGVNPPYVLNGHNFALEGLWYLSLVDDKYRELFEKGVKALRHLLPRFDARIWSMYDLVGTPANRKYQQIHVNQLQMLYNRTNNEIFDIYAKKFQMQLYLPFTLLFRMWIYPSTFLISIFFINTLGTFLAVTVILFEVQKIRRRNDHVR